MHVSTRELMHTVPSSFSLNKTWITLPMRDAAADWARAFFRGPCFSSRWKASAASLFSGYCLRGVEWWWVVSAYLRVLYCDVLTSCLGPVMYLSCGLSGASTASPLSFVNQSGRQILKQLPASFFSLFFFKPRRNLRHERDWLKWLQAKAQKTRNDNFTKAAASRGNPLN